MKQFQLPLYQLVKWLEFFLLIIYISLTFKNLTEIKITALIIFISGIFQGLLGWTQFHMQHMVGLRFLGEYIAPLGTGGLATIETIQGKVIRSYGTFPHPNILGAFLVLAVILGHYFVSPARIDHIRSGGHGTKWVKWLVLIALFIIYVAIFTTFSRLAWAGAGIGTICFIGYYLWNNQKKTALIILIPVIVSCATVFSLYKADLKARVVNSSSASVEGRYFYNDLGLKLFSNRPLLGVGTGNYVPSLRELFHMEPWKYQPAHNIFIFIAAETGLIGTVLFIMILFHVFRSLKNVKLETLSFSLILAGIIFITIGQFDHYFVTIQQGRLMFALVLGLIAALPNIYDYQKSN